MIYRQHSQGYRHDYADAWQVLDVDMSGMPCGKKAAMATAGYFAKQRNRRGRQLGRVLATRYREIVVDRLFDGKTQLNVALLPLVAAAEVTLELDEAKRERTLIRIDAGAGSISDINWLLMRGYFVVTKDYSTARARLLAHRSATGWSIPVTPSAGGARPRPGQRLSCWAVPAHHHPRRGALWLANGQWGVGVVVSSVPPPTPALAGLDATAATSDPRWRSWPMSISTTSAAAAWRPPSRRTSKGWASPSAAKTLAAQQVVALLGGAGAQC